MNPFDREARLKPAVNEKYGVSDGHRLKPVSNSGAG